MHYEDKSSKREIKRMADALRQGRHARGKLAEIKRFGCKYLIEVENDPIKGIMYKIHKTIAKRGKEPDKCGTSIIITQDSQLVCEKVEFSIPAKVKDAISNFQWQIYHTAIFDIAAETVI